MSGARTMDSMAGPSQMMRASQVIMSSQLVGSQAAAAGLVSDERLALRAFRRTFDAILLHPSWELAAAGDPARLLQELRLLTICPRGFVVAFVSKCSIGTVFSEMPRLGYAYVENLTWCLLTGDAKLAALDSRMGRRPQDALCAVCGKNHPIRCSHFTAVLFRREHKATKKLELKHQRNADVIFAHVRHSHHGAPSTVVSAPCVGDIVHPSLEIPEDVYHALNTLLPSAKGRFLELYANPWQSPPTARSNGWTRVSEHGGTETAEEPEWRW
ncbi:methyltransferase [Pycnococcus provasolii]